MIWPVLQNLLILEDSDPGGSGQKKTQVTQTRRATGHQQEG